MILDDAHARRLALVIEPAMSPADIWPSRLADESVMPTSEYRRCRGDHLSMVPDEVATRAETADDDVKRCHHDNRNLHAVSSPYTAPLAMAAYKASRLASIA